jgi:branched-chain amino acid transport system ATP-binding protein
VSAGYNGSIAIKNISLELKKGESVCLLGANGAGKTTTLKVIAGLLTCSEGEIIFKDKIINNFSVEKRVKEGIALVPEGRGIFPSLTVEENIEIGAFVSKDKNRMKENLKRIYELFPRLKERCKQKAGTLSGGEQQMLAIARGLMSDAEILMLDEPSLGLAASIKKQIVELLRELNKQGITILIAEQNVVMALSCTERGYVLQNGRIALERKATDLMKDEEVIHVYLGYKGSKRSI